MCLLYSVCCPHGKTLAIHEQNTEASCNTASQCCYLLWYSKLIEQHPSQREHLLSADFPGEIKLLVRVESEWRKEEDEEEAGESEVHKKSQKETRLSYSLDFFIYFLCFKPFFLLGR